MKSITFINGWGIPIEWISKKLKTRYPNHTITVVASIPKWEEKLDFNKNSQLHAYSLGTLLVANTKLPKKFSKTNFYAPILSFASETNYGSKITALELNKMIDAFNKNPLLTLNYFFRKCKLPLRLTQLPDSKENLLWGLKALSSLIVNPLPNINYYCGEKDSLINHKIMRSKIKKLITFSQGNHNIETLWHSVDEIKTSI